MLKRSIFHRNLGGLSELVSALRAVETKTDSLHAPPDPALETVTNAQNKTVPHLRSKDNTFLLSQGLKKVPFYSRMITELCSSTETRTKTQQLHFLLFMCGMPCKLSDVPNLLPHVSFIDLDEYRAVPNDLLFYIKSQDAVVDWSTEGFLRRGYHCVTSVWCDVTTIKLRLGWKPLTGNDKEMAHFFAKFAELGLIQLGCAGPPGKVIPFDHKTLSKEVPVNLHVRRQPSNEDSPAENVRLLGNAAVIPPTKGARVRIEEEYYARGSLNAILRSFEGIRAGRKAAGDADAFGTALKALEPTKQSKTTAARTITNPLPKSHELMTVTVEPSSPAPPNNKVTPKQLPTAQLKPLAGEGTQQPPKTISPPNPPQSEEFAALAKDVANCSALILRVEEMIATPGTAESTLLHLQQRLELLKGIRRDTEIKMKSLEQVTDVPEPAVGPPSPCREAAGVPNESVVPDMMERRKKLGRDLNRVTTKIAELKRTFRENPKDKKTFGDLVENRLAAQRLQTQLHALTKGENKALPSSTVEAEALPSSTVEVKAPPSSTVEVKALPSSTVEVKALPSSTVEAAECAIALKIIETLRKVDSVMLNEDTTAVLGPLHKIIDQWLEKKSQRGDSTGPTNVSPRAFRFLVHTATRMEAFLKKNLGTKPFLQAFHTSLKKFVDSVKSNQPLVLTGAPEMSGASLEKKKTILRNMHNARHQIAGLKLKLLANPGDTETRQALMKQRGVAQQLQMQLEALSKKEVATPSKTTPTAAPSAKLMRKRRLKRRKQGCEDRKRAKKNERKNKHLSSFIGFVRPAPKAFPQNITTKNKGTSHAPAGGGGATAPSASTARFKSQTFSI